KGDVHDIGKNIVGVVLGCNNYEVIDLGVMVPAEKIIDTAVAENADMIGLSVPLLIGGATTSKRHTAVKIAPGYSHETVHVIDASRAVPVVGALTTPEGRKELAEKNRAEQAEMRRQYEQKSAVQLLTYEEAIRKKLHVDWDDSQIYLPEFTGRRVLREFSLSELVPYIDWSPFFHTWEMRGRYPDLLSGPVRGP